MLRLVLVSCWVLGMAAAQARVWVVDRAGGPGEDFTEIQPALDAASAGDRVVVRAGSGYAGFTLSKGLDLDCAAGTVVSNFAVRDVPAGQSARVAGVRADTFSATLLAAVLVDQCAGPVLLASVQAAVATGVAGTVSNSGAVLLLDCAFSGGGPTYPVGPGSSGLLVLGSGVTLQRCLVTGGAGSAAVPYYSGGPGGAGLSVLEAAVLIAQGQFTGGSGGAARDLGTFCLGAGLGGDAVAGSGTLLCLGSARLHGGAGGAANGVCPAGARGQAVLGSGATPARVTADCQVQGGLVNAVTIPRLPWVASPGSATLGTVTMLLFQGSADTVLLLCLGTGHGRLDLPGIDGPLLLDFATVVPLPLRSIPIGDVLALALPVPLDAGLRDQFVFLQALAFAPGAPLPSLTNLGDLRLR